MHPSRIRGVFQKHLNILLTQNGRVHLTIATFYLNKYKVYIAFSHNYNFFLYSEA